MKKITYNHLINHRVLKTFHSIEHELEVQTEKNYLFALDYLGVLEVCGDKAIDFLQGQLSSDIRLLSETTMTPGAQCTVKGRILSLMDIITWQGTKLILPNDLMNDTVHSLSKTAMFSRVSLKANTKLSILGFYLQNDEDIIPYGILLPQPIYSQTSSTEYCCYHLGNGFYIFLTEAGLAEELLNRFMEEKQVLGSLTWHTLRLAQKQISIYPETRGLFLPHRLDLQHTPYLSFNKGCYKGQEIIARMHYKAILKHQLKIYTINTDQQIHVGQKLLQNSSGIELGELIDFSPIGCKSYLIAVSIRLVCKPASASQVLGETQEVSQYPTALELGTKSVLKEAQNFVVFSGHNTPIELIECPLYPFRLKRLV